MVPTSEGTPLSIEYHIQPQPRGYAMKSLWSSGNNYVRLEAHITVIEKLNWDLNLQV